MLELIDKRDYIFPLPFEHEVDVVGHEDEGQDDDVRTLRGLYGDVVHRHYEVYFFTEPEALLEVIRTDQINPYHIILRGIRARFAQNR